MGSRSAFEGMAMNEQTIAPVGNKEAHPYSVFKQWNIRNKNGQRDSLFFDFSKEPRRGGLGLFITDDAIETWLLPGNLCNLHGFLR
jgi:hypothetical protein